MVWSMIMCTLHKTEYDFKHIREEEGVDFSNEYITICIAIANPTLHVIGDTRKSLLKTLALSGDYISSLPEYTRSLILKVYSLNR